MSKRILIVGWCLPGGAKDGASIFMYNLAKYYISLGHHVEIFTIAKPEKLSFLDQPKPWHLYTQTDDGLTFNILCRPWGLLYTDPMNPLLSVNKDVDTEKIWVKFLEEKGGFDMVHFNDVNPLSLIEITKKTGAFVRYSFHNFFLLFPIEHLFSYSLYKSNPFQDLTIYEPTANHALDEYTALGAYDSVPKERLPEIRSEFEVRLSYGRYLLKEVIDEVLGASPPYIVFVRDIFGCDFPNIIRTDFALSVLSNANQSLSVLDEFDSKLKTAQYARKRFLSKIESPKRVLGVYSNLTRIKGIHTMLQSIELLSELDVDFEVRFYGNTDFDPDYTQFLMTIRDESPFIKKHTTFMGGYAKKDLPDITADTIATIGGASTSIGSTGTVYETLLEGNLPIFMGDYTHERSVRLSNENDSPSDLMQRRIFYKCADSKHLASILGVILDKNSDLMTLYDNALMVFITGKTVKNDFASVWQI